MRGRSAGPHRYFTCMVVDAHRRRRALDIQAKTPLTTDWLSIFVRANPEEVKPIPPTSLHPEQHFPFRRIVS